MFLWELSHLTLVMTDGEIRYDVSCLSVVNISPQTAEIVRTFKMLCQFVQARVNKRILNLWSLFGANPFSVTGKILVLRERAKFKTFVCSPE